MPFLVLLLAVLLVLSPQQGIAGDDLPLTEEQQIQEWGGVNALAIYGGVATNTNFTDSIFMPWTNELENMGFVGVAGSKRLGTLDDLTSFVGLDLGGIDDDFSIEGEVGSGFRFGDENIGEVWTGLFLRYHDLPWNDIVYTTIAVNTGVSLLFEQSDFEKNRDDENEATNLLHFMAPEMTFASPEDRNRELFLRFHHRSGVFGVFDNVVSGSTFITLGYRQRF